MRSRYQIRETHATPFVTSTIVEWPPVFTTAACCDILVDAIKYCWEHKEGRGWLVQQLGFFRAAHKTQSMHQVWQEGVHPQALPTDKILQQKVDYIHRIRCCAVGCRRGRIGGTLRHMSGGTGRCR